MEFNYRKNLLKFAYKAAACIKCYIKPGFEMQANGLSMLEGENSGLPKMLNRHTEREFARACRVGALTYHNQ